MTNFHPETNHSSAAWLTPERAVVFLPILAGLALAATLASAVITPQLVHLRERRSVVDVFEQKSEALPVLAQTLAQLRREQADVIAQQRRLLDLITGTAELETFLAKLNDLAEKYQVVLTSTKPGTVERAPVLSAPVVASAAVSTEDLAATDPLLMEGLEKRSARIVMQGPFVQVLAFLQSLEKMEVFVVTDDLSVVAAGASKYEAIKVRLGLRLLAYGAERSSAENGGS